MLLIAASEGAAAQSPAEDVRTIAAGLRLGAGYAQLIGLAATPDLSAATYDIDLDNQSPTLDVYRLPYQSLWGLLSQDADLYWRINGGYLRLETTLPVEIAPIETGSVNGVWTAYSVGGGLVAKIRLGGGFTLAPALDVGVARLNNDADYSGVASLLKPLVDGILFNWHENAWFVTPSIGLEWAGQIGTARTTVTGHVGRSWINSFDETDPAQEFNEAANAYSVRAEYARPTGMRLADRALDWLVYGGYAGFLGANRDALGFTAVGEIGAGFELPLTADSVRSSRVRLAAGYLAGPDVRGWSIALGLRY